jgi:glutamate-1-semialdehyde 2,1-aminomutase
MSSDAPLHPQSLALFERAAKVIPGGIYGHTTPAASLPLVFPYYAERAEGCRYWDADGREWIDYMCAYGPVVLGYNHPEVEEAAARQNAKGSCFNHPTSLMVELAEYLVEKVDFASWCVFGKNGSDMTTWAVQVAREQTKRRKILMIEGAYHGIDPWCTPGHGGLIDEDRAHVHTFKWNDLGSLDTLLKRHAGDVAGIIITPYHHPLYRDSVFGAPGFLQGIEERCRQNGIVFILDDVRAGFRIDLGGSHRAFGFTPDLICFCKAIANGHPLSAALGARELRGAASRVFLTGSYWNSAVPMAAALATLRILERDNVLGKLDAAGKKLAAGLEQGAARHGFTVTVSGPPAVPYMTFKDDHNLRKIQAFSTLAAAEGLFLHPHHNWFLCAAHTDAVIDETLARTDRAFARMPAFPGA